MTDKAKAVQQIEETLHNLASDSEETRKAAEDFKEVIQQIGELEEISKEKTELLLKSAEHLAHAAKAQENHIKLLALNLSKYHDARVN